MNSINTINIEINFPHITRDEHPNYKNNLYYDNFNTTKSFYMLKKQIVHDLQDKSITVNDLKMYPYQSSHHTPCYSDADELITDDISILECLSDIYFEEGDDLSINCEVSMVDYVTIMARDAEYDNINGNDNMTITLRMDKSCTFQNLIQLAQYKVYGEWLKY